MSIVFYLKWIYYNFVSENMNFMSHTMTIVFYLKWVCYNFVSESMNFMFTLYDDSILNGNVKIL